MALKKKQEPLPSEGTDNALSALLELRVRQELPGARLRGRHELALQRLVAEITRDLRRERHGHPPVAGDADLLEVYVPGRSIESVRAEWRPERIVKLASNENPLGASPRALDYLRAHIDEVHRYPQVSTHALRAALAAHHGVSADQVFVGTGSNEAIGLSLGVLRPPGATAVFAEKSFSMYRHYCRVHGVAFEEVPLQDHAQDVQGLLEAAHRTEARFLILTSPHNPTGHTVTEAELRALLRALPGGCLLLVDEAYGEFAEPLDTFLPAARLLADHSNLMVLRTFSKAYGLAGMRVGYALGSAPAIALMDAARQPFHLNRLALGAALAALGDRDFLERTVSLTASERTRVAAILRERGLTVPESGASFLFVAASAPDGCVKLVALDGFQQHVGLQVIPAGVVAIFFH